jgi:hypothetical protein
MSPKFSISSIDYPKVPCWPIPTLILLFSEMLKFTKNISSKPKKIIVKDNNEYLGIFNLLKWIFQNELIIWQTCVEMAKVLQY